jgi:hypothetical protein
MPNATLCDARISLVIFKCYFWVGLYINQSSQTLLFQWYYQVSLILSLYTPSSSRNETTNQLYGDFSIYQPAYSGVAWKDLELSKGCIKSCSYNGSSAKCILVNNNKSDTTVLGVFHNTPLEFSYIYKNLICSLKTLFLLF